MKIILPASAAELADVELAIAIRTAERIAGEAEWVAAWVDQASDVRGRVAGMLTEEDRLVIAVAAGINGIFRLSDAAPEPVVHALVDFNAPACETLS